MGESLDIFEKNAPEAVWSIVDTIEYAVHGAELDRHGYDEVIYTSWTDLGGVDHYRELRYYPGVDETGAGQWCPAILMMDGEAEEAYSLTPEGLGTHCTQAGFDGVPDEETAWHMALILQDFGSQLETGAAVPGVRLEWNVPAPRTEASRTEAQQSPEAVAMLAEEVRGIIHGVEELVHGPQGVHVPEEQLVVHMETPRGMPVERTLTYLPTLLPGGEVAYEPCLVTVNGTSGVSYRLTQHNIVLRTVWNGTARPQSGAVPIGQLAREMRTFAHFVRWYPDAFRIRHGHGQAQ